MDVDVWVRGTNHARTEALGGIPEDPLAWTAAEVRTLLTEMLLALERVRNPGGDPPTVALRGFSWIVSADTGGVLVHLELNTGTASAGPFAIDQAALTSMIARVMEAPVSAQTVH